MNIIWQDAVIGLASIFYIISEAIIIRSPDKKPPVSSALITAFFDLVLFITFITLDLWFASITSGVLFIEWSIIALQSYRLNQPVRKAE
jgi:hypothetical protein